MHRILRILLLTLCLALPAATAHAAPLRVVTTLFPLYDWARVIGGDQAKVSLLLPPGVEAHSFSPTPRDVLTIAGADIFIFTSRAMEPWVDSVLHSAANERLRVVNASRGILPGPDAREDHHDAIAEHGREEMHETGHQEEGHHDTVHEDHEAEHHAEAHGHGHDGTDPHIWLDFALAARMVETIAQAFAAQDPAHADLFHARARAYQADLADLDARFAAGLAHCENRTLVYSGHFAFGRFARRYHLTHVSPYKGFAPDAEPTPRDMAALIRTMREGGHAYIFYEEGIEPKLARLVARETGAGLLLLHGAHNISRDNLADGETYLSLMGYNLLRLKEGLVCR